MNRKIGSAVLVVAVAGSLAAVYGGWATITVENLPDNLVAGTPYNLTFSVRQHGVNLLSDLTPHIALKSGKHETIARAVPTNRAGYYTATLNVAQSGEWSADIQSGFGKSHLELMPITALDAGARRTVSFSQPERGQRLFVAKGCVTCHENARVAGSGIYKVGPALTDKRFEPNYLRKFLADPSIKPPTAQERMPDLNLSDAEIAALVAFLNGETPARAAASGGR